MSKYIIEIPDNTRRIWIDVFGEGYCYTRAENVDDLEELNSDYINENFGELQEEAYQRGYDEGYKKCLSVYDFDQPCISCEGYKRGLEDAWEAARKIALMDTETSENITGYFGLFRIMENLTPMQAIEKLKAYEDGKHSDRIEVGDVVMIKDSNKNTFVVTKVSNQSVWGVDADGSWNYWAIYEVIKTGKHYDIASILEAMRE